jgi:ankyrin repeat protein
MRELSSVSRETKPVVLTAPTCLLSDSSTQNRSETPLRYVAEPDFSVRLRSILLLRGSDPVRSSQHGWPPLAWAAWGGHLEAIRTSVRDGADTDRPGHGHSGWTPRVLAIHRGQLPIVCACAGAPPPARCAAI